MSKLLPITLLFDLDGTLSDPKVGITKSIAFALERMGKSPPDVEELRWCIGPPLHKSFSKLLSSDDLVPQAVAHYRERYSARGMFENDLYEGVHESLSGLKELGFRLLVATSKYNLIAEKVIDHFKLRSYFDVVYGSEHDGSRGDKTELIEYILKAENLEPDLCLMIGDREHDMIGAKNNNVRSVGAGWSYGSVEELLSSGAEIVLRHPLELKPHFEKMRALR